MSRQHQGQQLNYDYIVSGIYIGTNYCCQVHFNERLKQEGITVDISLEAEQVDTPFGVETYLWLPVEDHHAPTSDQLVLGVWMLSEIVGLQKKVYVHCKNGHGRAPTLVAAYLIKQGRSVEEAMSLIKTRRSSIHLEAEQVESLRKFSSTLR